MVFWALIKCVLDIKHQSRKRMKLQKYNDRKTNELRCFKLHIVFIFFYLFKETFMLSPSDPTLLWLHELSVWWLTSLPALCLHMRQWLPPQEISQSMWHASSQTRGPEDRIEGWGGGTEGGCILYEVNGWSAHADTVPMMGEPVWDRRGVWEGGKVK